MKINFDFERLSGNNFNQTDDVMSHEIVWILKQMVEIANAFYYVFFLLWIYFFKFVSNVLIREHHVIFSNSFPTLISILFRSF